VYRSPISDRHDGLVHPLAKERFRYENSGRTCGMESVGGVGMVGSLGKTVIPFSRTLPLSLETVTLNSYSTTRAVSLKLYGHNFPTSSAHTKSLSPNTG
jgi:hypothetical protein